MMDAALAVHLDAFATTIVVITKRHSSLAARKQDRSLVPL
jgi:hypothetical protein